jgi:hypothetical protein
LSRFPKPANFARNMTLFHSDSMNIGPIANQTAGGERAANTAQSAHRSYRDTITTPILNWSQSCRNHTMDPQSGLNSANTLRVYRIRLHQDRAVRITWRFLARTVAIGSVPTWTQAGQPGTVVTSTSKCWITRSYDERISAHLDFLQQSTFAFWKYARFLGSHCVSIL